MKIGLLARSDDVGLGVQSLEFYRHMHPDKVLVVDMTAHSRRGGPNHPEWYPDATWVQFDGKGLDEQTCRD